MNRRQFVANGAAAAAGALTPTLTRSALAESTDTPDCSFHCDDPDLQRIYDAALATLRNNIQHISEFDGPVLVEGSTYPGIWQECAPQEGLVFSQFASQSGADDARTLARNNHLAFFALQKDDGQLPCSIRVPVAGRSGGPGWGQIQMVVPIAATAWELARGTGDSELLDKAYAACTRWDAWLRRYRNTRGTGLCEGFCVYDTGMDHSTRWTGVPGACPGGDARVCPPVPGLPRLCPDLSATVYGARIALAAMARALDRNSDADRWAADAETIRRLILDNLCDPRDASFCDLDAYGRFVKVRSAAMLRVLGEHVPDAHLFETVWQRQVRNPGAFWPAYPLPSVALNDPAFVRPIPRNSWGGASQALTALRAPRWMEHYGKPADLAWMMQRWVDAIRRRGAFLQQLDPLTGDFTPDRDGYSPAALVLLDFLWRLSGVRKQGELLEWNIRPPSQLRFGARFTAQVHGRDAELICSMNANTPLTRLKLKGRTIAQVSGIVRLTTTRDGAFHQAIGIEPGTAEVTIRARGREKRIKIAANETISLSGAPLEA